MSFPSLVPNRRSIALGDYPVRYFRALSGAETRIRYGNQRSQVTMELYYEKLTASETNQIVTHYESMQGTTATFSVGIAKDAGWTSGSAAQGPGYWRYDGPPQIVANGGECEYSNVTVKLITVVG